MRVLLDTTYAHRAPYSGTAVYLDRLQAALSQLDGVEVVATRNARRRAGGGGGLGSVRNLLVDRAWLSTGLGRAAGVAGADVIHHPLPALARGAAIPQVITVHDLAFERLPDCFDRAWRTYAHKTHRAAALAAGAVICVSETTARDVQSIWGVPADRIVVAPHGPGQELASDASERAPEHFLYVGDDEPRKNVTTLLAAYRLYRDRAGTAVPLVLAGSAVASGPGISVEREPGRERLAELYAHAVALVHPSLYEGFGLTALEAMSSGTPVLAARSPGITEICGDAARYVGLRDSEALAASMTEIAASPALQAELSERGRRRAASFIWAASAQAHARAYSLALSRFGRSDP
jgi:glycosyltransferase involved in cell wall biosynthesis